MTLSETASKPVVVRTPWGFFVNSVIGAGLGVVVAHLTSSLGVAIAGAVSGREPVLTNATVEFGATGSDAVYLGGTAATLFAGTLFVLAYPGARDRSWGKLGLLWVILFCFREGFTDLVSLGQSTDSELALALEAFALPPGLNIVLAAAGAVGLLLLAVAAAPAFLGFARHRGEVATPRERFRFVASIGLMPAVVGSLAVVPFFLNDSEVVRGLPLVGLFVILSVAVAPWSRPASMPELGKEAGLSWGFAIGTIIALILLYIALAPGVPVPPWDQNLEWRFRP